MKFGNISKSETFNDPSNKRLDIAKYVLVIMIKSLNMG